MSNQLNKGLLQALGLSEESAEIVQRHIEGLSDRILALEAELKQVSSESETYRLEVCRLEVKAMALKALALAVYSSEFGEIECKDIKGKNWFDERNWLIVTL